MRWGRKGRSDRAAGQSGLGSPVDGTGEGSQHLGRRVVAGPGVDRIGREAGIARLVGRSFEGLVVVESR